MTTSIPSAAGVPGISGPPNWLGGAGTNLRLDDVRWRAAIKRAFGSGGTGGDFFRATQALEGADQFVYLTFRAGFAQQLNTAHDFVWVGLMKNGGSSAIVMKIQVHPAGFTPAGPPSGNPLGNVQQIQVFSLSGGNWILEGANPTWINVNTRYWLQSAADDPMDPNSRWAVQMKIKAKNAGTLLDNDGPNIGTGFQMWYVMRGSVGGNPTILAEYRIDGGATSPLNLNSDVYPQPSGIWDLFNLTSGAASTGGLALYYGDVFVQNAAYGTGWTIDNGQANTFICRPRNYSGALVPQANIAATFRIANWGSVGGDPNQINFNDSEWSYIPGNSEVAPVPATQDIGPIMAGSSPPATNPIAHLVPNMTLPPNKSKHQCVFCTMLGTNVNFLNESIYQNMNYDSASLLTREAEISIQTLDPFSSAPRDVYLALEKVNMLKNAPPGTNEGKFLDASFKRVMEKGGELAGKLKNAREKLRDDVELTVSRLEGLLKTLENDLLGINETGSEELGGVIGGLRVWLLEIDPNEPSKRLARVLVRLADFLDASRDDSQTKLNELNSELNIWLAAVGNDASTLHNGPQVFFNVASYSSVAYGAAEFAKAAEGVASWLRSNRPPTALPSVVRALTSALAPFANGNQKLKDVIAGFARDVARWLSGSARLEILVDVLSEVGLTEEEMDQLFPTFRVHVYHDTGFRQIVDDGTERPVLKPQSSFGLYVYHEGSLQGWETAIEGAERIEENLYRIQVPNKGTSKIKVKIQALEEGDQRLPDQPILKPDYPRPPGSQQKKGCLFAWWKALGF